MLFVIEAQRSHLSFVIFESALASAPGQPTPRHWCAPAPKQRLEEGQGGPSEFSSPSKMPSEPVHRAQAALFLQPPNPVKWLSPDSAAAAPKHATCAQHSRGLRRQIAAQPAARRGLRRTCPHARALGAGAGARRLRRAWPRTAATITPDTTGSGLNQSRTLDIVPRVAAPLVQEFIQKAH